MNRDIPATHDAADGGGRKPRLRFPKAARLTRSAEFLQVREKGHSVHGRLMVLGILKSESTHPARVGIITSSKVGSAVVRSRVRRRLREIFRLARPRLIPGLWMVVVAKASAARASMEALRAEWWQLGTRAGIFIA